MTIVMSYTPVSLAFGLLYTPSFKLGRGGFRKRKLQIFEDKLISVDTEMERERHMDCLSPKNEDQLWEN
jgi:hypothetical protein